jgi:hypothetical protein
MFFIKVIIQKVSDSIFLLGKYLKEEIHQH